ncbi:MAG: C40 family peptidase [Dokdonella sp.]|uniref:C40 family peptidase n=1 Tax=Dokdonella sp. TaxID=2291710 RepID=UPI0025B7C539|nr:C40 family peptidase [Dokdonella sp.]MBZ0223921.1 C40 family peptidase [Dokdonella sp.]MCC7255357.1 C40 family peptidase [Dokdonella sp.]
MASRSFLSCAVTLSLLLLGACASTPRHSRPSQATLSPAEAVEAANAVLFRAMSLVGTPYRYGGNTPASGFDCSGLVAYVFQDAAGLALPHQSAAMSALGGRKLDSDALQSGDLVFFAAGRGISHVGIYVGEGRFVHAPNSGGTVRLDRLDGAWWREHFAFGKRVF